MHNKSSFRSLIFAFMALILLAGVGCARPMFYSEPVRVPVYRDPAYYPSVEYYGYGYYTPYAYYGYYGDSYYYRGYHRPRYDYGRHTRTLTPPWRMNPAPNRSVYTDPPSRGYTAPPPAPVRPPAYSPRSVYTAPPQGRSTPPPPPRAPAWSHRGR
jgi:hypothetical protein